MTDKTLQTVTLNVNNRCHQLTLDPETPLLYILRNDLGIKSAKFGCGLGQCGACKVLIDGEAVAACQTTAESAQGHTILTLEGLGTDHRLDPLQEAFIKENAVQCGYCTSGMLVTARAFLDRMPHPTVSEIRTAMADTLCRCGIYDRALRAIQRAAGQPPQSPAYITRVAQDQDIATTLELPRPLRQTPDLDAWVRINADGTITLFTGKAELGQDLRTSIAMIGAEELDVPLARIRVVTADTTRSPNEGYTVSSMSLETSGAAIRYAAAEVRDLALEVAYEELEAPLERLVINDGAIIDPATGRSVTYWDLFGDRSFGVPISGRARPKHHEAYTIVGQPQERLDVIAKVTGTAQFVHDLDLPKMAYGRVLRPPCYGARLTEVDSRAVQRMPGILQVVRDGSFLGVIAEREEQAEQAVVALRAAAIWEPGPKLPTDDEALFDHLLSQPDRAFQIVDGAPVDRPVPPLAPPAKAHRTLNATYFRPYQMHASLGPSAAVARWDDEGLTVWTHSQGVYPLRGELAEVLDIPAERIRAIHMPGPGCYGHNGADDAALDAVLLARALPGRPVSLRWAREDEHRWEPYGAATAIQMQASLSADGEVIDWNHDVWGYAHSARSSGAPGSSSLLAAWHLKESSSPPELRPIMAPEVGIHRNATPLYTFPRKRIVKHFLGDSPLRVSALRGLGYYANVFAIESFVDELAHAAGVDAVTFRLRYLTDERARAVIEAAVERAGTPPVPGSDDPAVRGRGIAFAQYKNRQSYVAMVVDLSVKPSEGNIHLIRAVIAADVGQIVNPDGLSNQLEGGFTQAASWTLKEQVTFDHGGVTSVDWESYPILRLPEAPRIETVLLNRPGRPYLGVGEGTHGPVPAAIANAVFDAIGVRLRRIPFTPQRILAWVELGDGCAGVTRA